MARPYQPSLLRLLHIPTALVVAGSWITGAVLYGAVDGRWLPWGAPAGPPAGRPEATLPGGLSAWIDGHGSIGVALVLLFSLFAPYAVTVGWRQLRRPGNAVALLALALAIGSGLLMEEDAIREGKINSFAYTLHSSAWLLLTLAVLAHLLAVLRRGGWPLALAMFSLKWRGGDRPADWPDQLRRFFRRPA